MSAGELCGAGAGGSRGHPQGLGAPAAVKRSRRVLSGGCGHSRAFACDCSPATRCERACAGPDCPLGTDTPIWRRRSDRTWWQLPPARRWLLRGSANGRTGRCGSEWQAREQTDCRAEGGSASAANTNLCGHYMGLGRTSRRFAAGCRRMRGSSVPRQAQPTPYVYGRLSTLR